MGNAKEALKELLTEMEGFVSTKTVVGEAIHMDGTIILPLVDVSLGAGAGAREKDKSGGVGGGVTAKLSPSAVLVIKDGQTRLVNIKQQDIITKVLDMVPDVIDKFKGVHKEEDAAAVKAVMEASEEVKDTKEDMTEGDGQAE